MNTSKRPAVFTYAAILFILVQFHAGCASYAETESPLAVTDFGAVGDGTTLNTEALQKAIDTASVRGGGQVVFPKGTFLSGSLVLKSGVALVLKKDAVLLGSTDPAHYTKLNGSLAFLLADGAASIAVTGKGVIDGQGRELALTIDEQHHAGIRVDPKYNYHRMRPNEGMRPELIHFRRCDNVRVSEITLKDAACWVQTYDQCSDVEIDGITVISRAFWNNDGFDIVDCKRVRITNCDVNTADDGICLKSHSPEHFNDQIYIGDCTVRSSASAVKFGTASHGGFKNVTIENITVLDTFRSAIAIESVDGGFIENVQVSDITARNTGNAIFIRLGHRRGDRPGTIKNVSIKNVKAEVPFGRPDIDYDMRGPEVDFFHNPFPSSIVGIPGHAVENVVLENIEITYPGRASKGMAYIPLHRLDQVPEKIKDYPEFSMFGELPAWGFYVRHANAIEFKDITLKLKDADFRPAFIFDEVTGLRMQDITLPGREEAAIILKDVNDVTLDEPSAAAARKL